MDPSKAGHGANRAAAKLRQKTRIQTKNLHEQRIEHG